VDLRFSEQDEDFRKELRAWLDTNLPAEMRQAAFWSDKSDDESFEIRREWEGRKALAGFAGIQWPTEYGGRGGTPTMKAIYDEEMAKANAPSTVNPLGLAFLAPTSRSATSSSRCCTTRSSGARASPSPAPAPTWPRCR
jgi:alkylation response protein AidB-like acyl-CoA dehydrogenase